MKINNIGLSKLNPYNRNANQINREQQNKSSAADKVEISTTAKEMQQISQHTAERKEKIANIKAQVENGTYEIDPDKIAKSIYKYYFQN